MSQNHAKGSLICPEPINSERKQKTPNPRTVSICEIKNGLKSRKSAGLEGLRCCLFEYKVDRHCVQRMHWPNCTSSVEDADVRATRGMASSVTGINKYSGKITQPKSQGASQAMCTIPIESN
jgi:hypothetical protein